MDQEACFASFWTPIAHLPWQEIQSCQIIEMCNNDVEMLSSARPEYDFKQGNQKTTQRRKPSSRVQSSHRCIEAEDVALVPCLKVMKGIWQSRRNWDGSILFRFVDGSMWSPNGWFKMVTVNQLNLAKRMKIKQQTCWSTSDQVQIMSNLDRHIIYIYKIWAKYWQKFAGKKTRSSNLGTPKTLLPAHRLIYRINLG